MQFIVATKDYAGLGFAVQQLLKRRSEFKDAYWVWDLNHSVDENEVLRREGFRVLGGGAHAYTMEHDRKACLDFVGRYGLETPPSFSFDSPGEAMKFCAGHAAAH